MLHTTDVASVAKITTSSCMAMYICMYVRSYVCMYVVMYVCTYVVMYVYMYVKDISDNHIIYCTYNYVCMYVAT